MHAKEIKRTNTKYFWPTSFPLSLSLSLSLFLCPDTLSYVQVWRHHGSMTGYSLCSTPQPGTGFLLMHQIIGAIIIPNHKEIAQTIQGKKILFHMHTRKYELFSLRMILSSWDQHSSHIAVSFKKEMKPDRESDSTSLIRNDTSQSNSYRKYRHCKGIMNGLKTFKFT